MDRQSEKITMFDIVCNSCIHKDELDWSCKAFDKIPDIILTGENDHSKPLPEQKNDIVFEKIK